MNLFCDEFPPFCKHKKGHQHQQNIFNFLNKIIAKTWLNFLMDDIEEYYKIEKNEKMKNIIDVIIIITISNSSSFLMKFFSSSPNI